MVDTCGIESEWGLRSGWGTELCREVGGGRRA